MFSRIRLSHETVSVRLTGAIVLLRALGAGAAAGVLTSIGAEELNRPVPQLPVGPLSALLSPVLSCGVWVAEFDPSAV